MGFNYNKFIEEYHQLEDRTQSSLMQFCKDVHGLELLAVGSMKAAFKTCDGQCLKIAMSGNLQESVSILKQCSCECFPKLFAYDKLDMSSALYELCEQCGAKDIANVFGLNPIHYAWLDDIRPQNFGKAIRSREKVLVFLDV